MSLDQRGTQVRQSDVVAAMKNQLTNTISTLATMPPQERAVIASELRQCSTLWWSQARGQAVLELLESHTYAEVAELLGIRRNTVHKVVDIYKKQHHIR